MSVPPAPPGLHSDDWPLDIVAEAIWKATLISGIA